MSPTQQSLLDTDPANGSAPGTDRNDCLPEVYLVDGSAYIYRAYHAIRPLANTSGLPTHAVYGFTTILRRILREKEPDCLAVAFDTKGPVFRHRMYPEYKANRPPMPDDLVPQIPYIHKMVDAYNILSMEHEDKEADDLIAAAVLIVVSALMIVMGGFNSPWTWVYVISYFTLVHTGFIVLALWALVRAWSGDKLKK